MADRKLNVALIGCGGMASGHLRAYLKIKETEPELFSGRPVGRAHVPFLTRLGLPVLHDPALPVRAVRRLVNEGHAWVYERGPDAVSYHGPARPVPPSMSDAELERLIM